MLSNGRVGESKEVVVSLKLRITVEVVQEPREECRETDLPTSGYGGYRLAPLDQDWPLNTAHQ